MRLMSNCIKHTIKNIEFRIDPELDTTYISSWSNNTQFPMLNINTKLITSITTDFYPEPKQEDKMQECLFTNSLYPILKGIDRSKFKEVINAGFAMLPLYLKHEDQEIADIAWVLSKYFSGRNKSIKEDIL